MKHDDAELIERTLEGDQQAFAALVEKYQEQIHALAWQKIGDFHIAQEITQDAFITAYQKLSTLTHHNRFAGWLYVITSNKCNMWHRKKKPKLQSLEETDPMELEEVYYSEYTSRQREESANQNRRTIVRKLLNKLRESERTVVTMHYLAGLTCEEIGRFLGVSPNTVKSRLHRAREKLKKEEAVIQENLSSFQLPTQMTENIMKEISHLSPVTPSGSKPLVPLAVSAASAIIVFLLIGFGAQNLIRFQKPYSLESTSERTIEIVDTPIVLESPVKPAVSNQVGRSDVLSNNDGTGQKPDTSLFAAAQTDDAEISTSKAEWGQTNGPYGGCIQTLFATSEGVLLAGTRDQGIFRSTDLGDSWASANVELPDIYEGLEVSALAFAQKGDTIYASVPPKLYASTDTGKTWSHVPTDPQHSTISGIVIIGNRIYISSSPGGGVGGVWYSDDEKSWIPMNDGLTDLRIRELANIGTTLVVGTEEGGAFRKKATEDSWQPINSAFSMQPNNQERINKAPASGLDPSQTPQLPSVIRVDSFAVMDNLLYTGMNIGEGKGVFRDGGLFRSDDEGDSWTRITAKEMQHTVEALDVFGSTLYASTFGSGVFRSNDKGDSWIPVSKGMTDQLVTTLVAVDDETVFAGTMDVGIFRTKDGGNSWMEANTGIMSTSVVDLEVLGDRIYAFALAGSRLLYSANGGESWESVEVPPKPIDFSYSRISALNGKLYVGATRFDPNNVVGGIFQLDEQNNALIEIKTDIEMYAIECMHIVGTTFYVGTQGQGVFLWNEGWDSWLNVGLEGQFVTDISLSDANIYARTDRGDIYRLKDEDQPWELTKNKKGHRRFAESRKIDNKLYLLSGREGLIRSLDGGNSWTQLNDGIEHVSIETVEIDGTDFYIGTTQHGVYKWLHKDEKWEQLGSLSLPVQSLAVLDGFLYAGTQAGVHRIQIEK
ncbi:MAG: sigma-70 family RNA polymerase sigma factor [Candidatus Poribacteria bacterium]|nr:sigma-70 family RNA polymerase sigma factor [Candidatus Poribacteria bacterium]MDE0317815.1 sigma-70 family RNA polymerase sigma factor [Candidatus Poribacteria bacterium]